MSENKILDDFDKCVEECVQGYRDCYEADTNLCLSEAYNYCIFACSEEGKNVNEVEEYYEVEDCIDECMAEECPPYDHDCEEFCSNRCIEDS